MTSEKYHTLEQVKQDGWALEHASDELKADRDVLNVTNKKPGIDTFIYKTVFTNFQKNETLIIGF